MWLRVEVEVDSSSRKTSLIVNGSNSNNTGPLKRSTEPGFSGKPSKQRHREARDLDSEEKQRRQPHLPLCQVLKQKGRNVTGRSRDFNEIVKAEENTGGASRSKRQMVAFREALDFCGFRDLGYVGSPFTWCNNQFNVAVTWIRLDRGMATTSWIEMFPSAHMHHIEGSLSDHTPLWMVLDDGTRVEDKQDIRKTMVNYFKTMFTSSNPTNIDSILDGINTKVTTAMNAELTKCFTAEEVEQALKQMKPMTAPGPDGMPPIFYKAYWSTVGPDVINATLSVLNSNEETTCWLEERIREELMPHEANAILNIPLSDRRPEDTLIWQTSKNGVNTTKSAYRLLADSEALKQPGQSNPTANNGLWKKLWSLDIPNKVKHFLWRASCESLPTKKNLFKRKIAHNDRCKICNGETEDTIHALWDCFVLKEIWWEMDICRSNLSTRFTCFRDILTGILNSQEPNQAEVFASVAWEIWRKRNALRVGDDSIPCPKIFGEATDRLQVFQAARFDQILTIQRTGITS
uniref:Reverse transcriptase zinc-binding domain-containing protein n=1 Tax=Quercus lobata TaxID=97700 RepID=A0A7N2N3A5_QUELO